MMDRVCSPITDKFIQVDSEGIPLQTKTSFEVPHLLNTLVMVVVVGGRGQTRERRQVLDEHINSQEHS